MKTSYLILLLFACNFCLAQSLSNKPDKKILLTEIFPDPTPGMGLPEKEFVEIFNSTSTAIDLQGWQIADADKLYTFGSYMLASQQYLILCKNLDTAFFKPYGKVYGFAAFISLNNAGDTVSLLSPGSSTADRMWYGSTTYTGGATFELSNYLGLCASNASWHISQASKGGTPGSANSLINTYDSISPSISSVAHMNDTLINVKMNTQITADAETRVTINNEPLKSILSVDRLEKTIQIYHNFDFLSGKLYQLKIAHLKNCDGTPLPAINKEFLYGDQSDSNMLIINEVLFNAYPGGVDFVELYNRSSNFCDLNGYQIGSLKTSSIEKEIITEQSYLVPPKSYVVLTADIVGISAFYNHYKPDNTIEMELPSYNNDYGTVVLYGRNEEVIDKFQYTEKMHLAFLKNYEGVSLERISAESPANISYNWHSAAAAAGNATPGKINSQTAPVLATQGWAVDPLVFSPDGDGHKDFTALTYVLEQPGQMATVKIFDAQGQQVKCIAQNTSLGTQGFLQWDGMKTDNTRAPMGNYLLFIQLYNLKGEVQEFKKEVTLSLRK